MCPEVSLTFCNNWRTIRWRRKQNGFYILIWTCPKCKKQGQAALSLFFHGKWGNNYAKGKSQIQRLRLHNVLQQYGAFDRAVQFSWGNQPSQGHPHRNQHSWWRTFQGSNQRHLIRNQRGTRSLNWTPVNPEREHACTFPPVCCKSIREDSGDRKRISVVSDSASYPKVRCSI